MWIEAKTFALITAMLYCWSYNSRNYNR